MKLKAKKDSTLLQLILAYHAGMSNSKAKKLIDNHTVKCGDKILKRPDDVVAEGQVVEFLPKSQERFTNRPGLFPAAILPLKGRRFFRMYVIICATAMAAVNSFSLYIDWIKRWRA